MEQKTKGAALVTGGAVRIGRSLALALAKDGYDIALHYNSSEEEAEKTAADIEKTGRECKIFKCDLSGIKEIPELIKDVKKEFNKLNLLVNNASIFEECSFMQTDEDIFNRHININFRAPFFLSREFASVCKNGQIVNILDTNIAKNGIKHFAYLLSKKSLADFTKMAARTLGPDVRVNGLAIGATELSKDLPKGYLKSKQENVPLKKISTLDEVACSFLSLVNNESLTGQIIFIDGGENLI